MARIILPPVPFGECECGCGQPAPIARQSITRTGQVKGQPLRFVQGHHNRFQLHDRRPLPERFWEKVNKNGPIVRPELGQCWMWTAGRGTCGYGRIGKGGAEGGTKQANRIAWELMVGPIPPGMQVLHTCDNPACVKALPDETGPAHLWLGTSYDNVRDMWNKGRQNYDRPMLRGKIPPNAKLTLEAAEEMRELRAQGWLCKDLGKKFGVSKTTVTGVLSRKLWTERREPMTRPKVREAPA
jgi:HNH endonuclease